MAQLTESLVREFLQYADSGRPAPYTMNEFKQLCYAWLNLNGRPLAMPQTVELFIPAGYDKSEEIRNSVAERFQTAISKAYEAGRVSAQTVSITQEK